MRSVIEPCDLAPEVRAKICNGIGPAKGTNSASKLAWRLSWPFLVVAECLGILAQYKEAGDRHDVGYAAGGTWEDKRRCDGLFLGNCINCVADWPLLLRPAAWGLSFVFWAAVAVGGAGSFKFREAPLTLWEIEALHGQ